LTLKQRQRSCSAAYELCMHDYEPWIKEPKAVPKTWIRRPIYVQHEAETGLSKHNADLRSFCNSLYRLNRASIRTHRQDVEY
jgi:hypothetical protein